MVVHNTLKGNPPLMIIRRMHPQDETHVLKLGVTNAQEPFVGKIQDILDDLTEQRDCHVIEDDGVIVGFFIIDRAYADQYDFCSKNEIGFRAYFIDESQQGNGYGKASILTLKDHLRAEYPGYPAVVLSVNCRNDIAYRLYLRGGFTDTGELYHGGSAGPQHILRMALT
jgi:RimJ/RimL family protein N-acetyltransferase